MSEILDFAFMQRALLAALLVGICAPLIGVFIVQRGMSLIGDGMGHVALTGVGLGLLTGRTPIGTALVVTVLGAIAIELIRARRRASSDVALAIFFYGGIAGGVVLTSKAPESSASLDQYLFGAITTTTTEDLRAFALLAGVLVTAVALLWSRLFVISDDEDFARAAGMPVLAYNMLLTVLVAVTVVLSMRVIGLLLISALMVLPVATAQLVAPSFRATLLMAAALGPVLAIGGVVGSYYWDTPSGGTIVLLAIGLFAVTIGLASLRDRLASR